MKTILNDIRDGRLKKAYLLYGEEQYLKLQYKDKLLTAMEAKDDTMNFSSFAGKGIDPKEIVSLAETLPFFADYRTILIENSGFFKNACDELCEYFKGEPAETTRFIFVEKDVDKRNRLYKIVKDYGNAVEFGEQTEETIMKWIAGILAKEGKQITASNAAYIIHKNGTDMSSLRNEIEKLCCYTDSRSEITKEDIDAVIITNPANHVFDMMDAIAEKKQSKALSMYYELISLKESPLGILALLSRHFNKLLQVKDLKTKGYANGDIAKKASVPPFAVGKYLNQASRFKIDMLVEALEDCVVTEDNVKKGLVQDKLGVEILICKYSSSAS